LNRPSGLAIDRSGNIADFNNGRIREILPNGTIVTYSGSGNQFTSGDSGPALKAGMNPIGLAVGDSGLLYLTAIFTQNQAGTGQRSIVNCVTNSLADPKNPVHAGDVISIYCTGLGPVDPAVPEGVAASTTVRSPTVTKVAATVGGQPAGVSFAGLAPGLIGVFQVNVMIPIGVTPGDNVPVVLTEGSQVSQPVTISVR
jgi:hypothetical protein